MHLASTAHARHLSGAPPQRAHQPQGKTVLLINLGTPASPEPAAVRAYLREFLSDHYVIRLPKLLRWMNPLLGRLIARWRGKSSAELYRSIWKTEGSPLLTISRKQATALRLALPKGWQVLLAMRYGEPSIRRVLEEVRARGVSELVVVPMYPHFAGPTTGTALELFYKIVQEIGLNISITVRTAWYDDTAYIAAQAAVIRDQIAAEGHTPENTFLLFSAHSMPVSYIRQGDPYLEHITRSVELVRDKLNWPADRQDLCFQSKLGPVEWLTPDIGTTLKRLAKADEKRVLVCPISFTADCLETVQELGMFYRDLFENELGGKLHRCPALNDHPSFIAALRSLVLRGPQRCPSAAPSPVRFSEAASLRMVGISVPNLVKSSKGPQLRHDDAEGLRSVKLPAEQVTSLLNELCADKLVLEAWVLNTCNRFEVYAWLPATPSQLERETLGVEIMRRVFGERDHSELAINTLEDIDAVHHLLRTAAGLNSVLPGETDIIEQLRSALRLAQAAKTADTRATKLVTRAIEIATRLREQTDWGNYTSSYCSAVLGRLADEHGCDWHDTRIAVIGRSTTCLSMLKELVEQHKVPSERITFIHKGSRRDGQIKKMRKLIPKGHKIRVESYEDSAVLAAVQECDLVVYGIDQRHAVLDGRRLKDCLGGEPKHRIIVDFNSFGSTVHLDEVPGLTLWDINRIEEEVGHYARELCGRPAFQQVVEMVENDVEQCAGALLDQFRSFSDAKAELAAASENVEPVAV